MRYQEATGGVIDRIIYEAHGNKDSIYVRFYNFNAV